ncbi:MAG TPA: hypothetical protein VF120_09630 [Ktedonobacterales bacterium]
MAERAPRGTPPDSSGERANATQAGKTPRAAMSGVTAQARNGQRIQRARAAATYWGFRSAAAILSRLPERLVYAAAPAGGLLFWLVAPGLRARATANLAHIPRLANDKRALRWAVRGVFYYALLNYLDLLRGARLDTTQVRRICSVENEEVFDAMMAQGRGMVLFAPHTSGWELAGALLHAKGVRVAVPAERIEPPELFSFFQRTRERHGVRILPADSRETLHTLVQFLKEGGVVVFVVDRYVNGASSPIPFFGERAPMPMTPAALALRLGVPVGLALPFRLGPDRIHLPFIALREAAPPPAKGAKVTSDETAEELHQRFLEQVEGFLETHPEQWVSALSPVWSSEEAVVQGVSTRRESR